MNRLILSSAWRGLAEGVTLAAYGLRWTRRGSARQALDERLGLPATMTGLPKNGLWMHAASVGEVRALTPLARTLIDTWGPLPAFVTTSSRSGRDAAGEALGLPSRLAPLDARGPLTRFIEALQPRLHLVVETEIWPERLRQLAARRIPVVFVSARLSARRWSTYERLAPLYQAALGSVLSICPASPADAERFLQLGFPAARLGPIGSLKWDAVPTPPSIDQMVQLGAQFGIDRRRDWLVLGSVHPGEALELLRYLALPPAPLPCGVIVAPRHPERFALELGEIERCGRRTQRISAGPARSDTEILLLDRIGLLPAVYPLARIATLGGSFVPVGGHTPLEAAAGGCAIVAGPHRDKQLDLCEPLEAAGALLAADSIPQAAALIKQLLADRSRLDAAGAAGREVAARGRGISSRLTQHLTSIWNRDAR